MTVVVLCRKKIGVGWRGDSVGKAVPDMYLWLPRKPAYMGKHTLRHGGTPTYPTPTPTNQPINKKGGVCMVLYFVLFCVFTPSSSFITSSRDSYVEFTSLCVLFVFSIFYYKHELLYIY